MTLPTRLSFRRPWLFAAVSFLLVLALTAPCEAKKAAPEEFNAERDQLIALMLSQQLPAQHFSHHPLDDALSRRAFDLYLRQLDPRKRFLLQADAKQLQAFADHIDEELSRGKIVLADAGMTLLNDRIDQVDKMIDPILNQGFDFDLKESLEIEPKKLEFAENIDKLKERWHLSLKMQVLEAYFDLLETKAKQQPDILKNIHPKQHPAEIQEAIKKVRESTHRALSRLAHQSRQDHYDRYFDAVARAYDPHSDYMAPTSKEDFDIQMSGSLEGIGALLREDEGLIKVVRIIPGSAAEKQGKLQAEDTILAVAEKDGEPVDISEMRIREAVSLIRGPKGTEVRLTVQKPDGTKRVIPIIRDVVRIEETYAKSTTIKNGKTTIGYLRIPSFYRDFTAQSNGKESRNVSDDTLAELIKLKKQKIGGLIVDLRNNGGGALADAVQISGLFLPGGPIVQVKDSQGSIRVLEDEDRDVAYGGPLIILVNQFSASASEIVAAALQDYGRAFIIGSEHTHGKGTVQAMMDMNKNLPLLHLQDYDDLGALKLTIQKFYRVNGGSTQFKGVEPDLVVPSIFDYLETGEKYMDYSLPWDQVDRVDYTRWRGNRIPQDQMWLAGKQWIDNSAAFKKIKEETQKTKIRAKQTTVTVALDSMWKEREEVKATRKEAKAAGLMQEDGDDDESKQEPPEQKLDKQVATDPYIQLAVFLLKEGRAGNGSAGAVR
ncbi:MAG: carboxy terminal-processing peptidase [Desulfobulbus sp.]|jgi:carboxyl-terminal processing protease|uniref:carboxy terminal-processing peptidase n=1 Tax=Desulfobulbus sp. TaxID=895 RepID=UPI00283EBA79|nr:carboxy terminal-processing peptidase [Desulfobulbus sp.]MDR2549496.1 carboxy terminal-processing peptidase [Desulfobulbus sp.]